MNQYESDAINALWRWRDDVLAGKGRYGDLERIDRAISALQEIVMSRPLT